MKLTKADSSAPLDCSTDPVACLKKMFIDMTMGPRINAGQNPVRRDADLHQTGSAAIPQWLSDQLKQTSFLNQYIHHDHPDQLFNIHI